MTADNNYWSNSQSTYFGNLANQYKADIITWIVSESDAIKGLAYGPDSTYNRTSHSNSRIIPHLGG